VKKLRILNIFFLNQLADRNNAAINHSKIKNYPGAITISVWILILYLLLYVDRSIFQARASLKFFASRGGTPNIKRPKTIITMSIIIFVIIDKITCTISKNDVILSVQKHYCALGLESGFGLGFGFGLGLADIRFRSNVFSSKTELIITFISDYKSPYEKTSTSEQCAHKKVTTVRLLCEQIIFQFLDISRSAVP